jgi:hypothetical protein
MSTLIDCRGVKTLLSSDDLRAIAQDLRKTDLSERGPTAMIAGSDAVYGLLRMYEAFTDRSPAQIRAFRDEAEARAWLAV